MASIIGKKQIGDKIGWEGKDTRGLLIWKASANTYYDLYYKLIDLGVISVVDGYPHETYAIEKAGKSYEDFEDEDGYPIDGMLEKFVEEHFPTDEEFKTIIKNENGNAYYQTFYNWDDSEKEWVEE